MGAFNQIEIYLNIEEMTEVKFISRLEEVLSLSSIGQDERLEFINSIKLIDEVGNKYFQYKRTQFNFELGEKNKSIAWHIDLFYWQNQTNKYEIRLGFHSETLMRNNTYPKMYYKSNLIVEIEKLMEQIHNQRNNELILFTDEASEGEFMRVLEGENNTINFLFDIAIIPNELNWKHDSKKYHVLLEKDKHRNYRSKHPYMKFKKKTNIL